MNPTLDSALRFHQDALSYRAARQEVIASNIANADTPGYRARDIGQRDTDFAATLRTAQSGRESGSGLSRTSSRHIAPAAAAPGGAQVTFRTPLQPTLDGNTVSMDVERAQFADNAVRYEANLMFISGQLKSLLAAIQG